MSRRRGESGTLEEEASRSFAGRASVPAPGRARPPIQPGRELLTAHLHHRKLENLFAEAPVTRWYGATIRIEDGAAEVRIPVREEFLHAAGSVHGSVYFRALDDAAFFAANSRVDDALLLTASFHLHFTRPADEGVLVASGSVVHEGGRLIVAEAELRDDGDRLLARGTGTFARSLIALSEEVGYRLPPAP